MKTELIKFKEIVDEEIQAYEQLEDLYSIKQEVLVKGNSDKLWDVDSKIVKNSERIKKITQKRKEISKYLGHENFTMSEIIEKAKNANDVIADTLELQKSKLKILGNSLIKQESTNINLIKHGLTMVSKSLDIIVNVLAPHSKQYNNLGQNVNCDNRLVSSIIEDV
jgi:hypothetical protein